MLSLCFVNVCTAKQIFKETYVRNKCYKIVAASFISQLFGVSVAYKLIYQPVHKDSVCSLLEPTLHR